MAGLIPNPNGDGEVQVLLPGEAAGGHRVQVDEAGHILSMFSSQSCVAHGVCTLARLVDFRHDGVQIPIGIIGLEVNLPGISRSDLIRGKGLGKRGRVFPLELLPVPENL